MLRVAAARRCLSSKASSSSSSGGGNTWGEWLQVRRHPLLYTGFSGILTFISLHLVNTRHRADDAEAALASELDKQAQARHLLLKNVPVLARDAGLPASKQGPFEVSLRTLLSQIDEDPVAVEKSGPAAPAAPVSTSPAAAPPVAKQKAVW